MLTLVLATALAVAPAPAVANPTLPCCQTPAVSLQAEPAATQPCAMPSMMGPKADQPDRQRPSSRNGRH